MSLVLRFEVELLSDYHVSAGHGLGPIVDSALHRDRDGTPVLRGTTLNGLLRDGLYRLLQLAPLQGYRQCQASGADVTHGYCGQHTLQIAEEDYCPVCRVFGSPRAPKRWHIASARPLDLPISEKEQRRWQVPSQTAAKVAPHVRVDPRTRRVEEGKLFFREEGDSRLTFGFTATCEASDDGALDEAALLVAASRYVQHLGASRRRGRGRCRFHLKAVEVEDKSIASDGQDAQGWLLGRFEDHWLNAGSKQRLVDSVRAPAFVHQTASETDYVHIQVIARLDEPLILSTRAEAGNEFATLDFIPGPTMRGALAARVATRYGLQDPAASAYKAFVDLFFRGGACFSPLYPAFLSGSSHVYPAIRSPADLLRCEVYPGFVGHHIEGYARQDDPNPKCPKCKGKLTPERNFWSMRTPPDPVKPELLTEMHLRINPKTQRAADGDLFSFRALAPGQFFVGEITCRNAVSWEQLCSLAELPNEGQVMLHLGKANRRGYGQVALWVQPCGEEQARPWYPLPLPQRLTPPVDEFTLTLLTDTIVLDAWGRFQQSFDNEWLSNALGVAVEVKRSFVSTRLVDGFNTYLGLPRWRDLALDAGSSAGLRLDGAIDPDVLINRLALVEAEGIGLRRNEGFGKVVFNHPIYNGCTGVDMEKVRLELRPVMKPFSGVRDKLELETFFKQEWAETLARNKAFSDDGVQRSPFRDKRFVTLARVLRDDPSLDSADKVAAWVDDIGRGEHLLGDQAASLKVREAEKDNLRFVKVAGRGGTELLKELVKELNVLISLPTYDSAERRHLWRLGLEMLADHIAIAAEKEEKGS